MSATADRGGWDVHTHLIPEEVIAAAKRGEFGLAVQEDCLVGRAFRAPLGRIAQPTALVDWITAKGLDGAFVSPPPPLYRTELSDDDRKRWVALVNEGMAAVCSGSGARLRPLAYLPAEDPRLAAEVAGHLGPGFAGVTLGTDLRGSSYAEPGYDPMWATLVERDLPAFLHPGECPDSRLDRFYFGNLLGNPYETALAAGHIIFGGVFDRFPGLRVLLAHGGGVVAAVIGRWEHAHGSERPGIPRLAISPGQALRCFFVDNLVHSPAVLALLTAVVGDDRIVFGSDWPFPMGVSAVRPVEGAGAMLQERILKANVRGLFRS